MFEHIAAGQTHRGKGGVVSGKFGMEGVRSLKIAVEAGPQGQADITFQSLGDEPELVVTLAHRGRVAAWAG